MRAVCPFVLAYLYGDPHFRTLDGLEYLFNGRGEYWLMQIKTLPDDLDNFLLQGRFEQINETCTLV